MLWTPAETRDFLIIEIDPNQSTETEWENMFMLNAASNDWLKGRLDTGTYFDMLDACGIEPFSFVGKVEKHVFLLTR